MRKDSGVVIAFPRERIVRINRPVALEPVLLLGRPAPAGFIRLVR